MDAKQPPKPNEPRQPARPGGDHFWPWALLGLFLLYYLITQSSIEQPQKIAYSVFLEQLRADRVEAVELQGQQLAGHYRGTGAESSDRFRTVVPSMEDDRLLRLLEDNNVALSVKPDQSPMWMQLLIGFLPWLLIFAFLVYSSRLMRSRMGGGMWDFGKSKARRYERQEGGPGFEAVAGLEHPKRDMQEIIDYLKEPERYRRIGAHIPRGVLMMGPPGSGKTLLARSTAAEAGVPFFSISGSEFIELYVGVGASRVREMFEQARKEAPALIFIDEIDSVGRTRGAGLGGGHDEREQTLNQILAEMDGFEIHEPVVVLAATNRPDVLDPALLRPGRFDRKVVLELPQRKARREILDVHVRKVPLARDVDLDAIAAATVGFSGADLANLVNEAALRAARYRREEVCSDDFHAARDTVLMGERRDDLLNDEERRRVACHESGHAIAAFYAEFSDPVEKVSIVPRGRALGMTEQRPEQDRHNFDERYLKERLRIMLAGRCAERLVYGYLSSGAADDLKQATQLARRMVAQWGMSNKLGPVGYTVGEEHPFLGRELTAPKDISEATAERIDREVADMLRQAEADTSAILSEHRQGLDNLIGALLERESLNKEEIAHLLSAEMAKPRPEDRQRAG